MIATYKMNISECTPEFFEKLNAVFGLGNATVEITVVSEPNTEREVPTALLQRMKNVERNTNVVRFDAERWQEFVKVQ
ncbi:MAG: hypothetical protein JNJ85_10030 [Candidatus Kapabacteria bacterium]|nr:hypothetical protein [Candidatus Kapabacteria bacterium]